MISVSLNSLTITGFKSFAKETKVEFSTSSGLKFITGRNEVDAELGANGAGKSTIWDALFWCCYGVSVRGKRASELLAWNEPKTIIDACFNIGGVNYTITRTASPDRTYIDGAEASQEQIVELLRLTKDQALQAHIFGQDVPRFYDMSVPERGDLLDQVLNLGLWGEASQAAHAASVLSSQNIIEIEKRQMFAAGKLEGLEDLDVLRQQSRDWRAQQQELFDALVNVSESLQAERRKLHKAWKKAKESSEAFPMPDTTEQTAPLQKQIGQWTAEIAQIKREKKSRSEEHRFYKDTKTCASCKQPIDKHFANEKCAELLTANDESDGLIKRLEKKVANAEATIESVLQGAETQRTRAKELQAAERLAHRAYADARAKSDRVEQELDDWQASSPANPFKQRIQARKEAATKLQTELDALRDKIHSQKKRFDQETYWKNGFKRVRLFLIKQVLAQLELEVAQAAHQLGLVGWKILFATETETRSKTIKSGVQMTVYAPGSTNILREWSPGELQRVRIAVQMGMSSMIQRYSSVSYDFAVFDEPSNWLSSQGIEQMLDYLKNYADSRKKSVWLVDHRALVYAGFDETWTVVKTSTGSEVLKG